MPQKGFNLAEYQRGLDEIVGEVSPDDAPANQRLAEGNYPYQ